MKTGDIIDNDGNIELVGDVNELGGYCDDCSLDHDKVKVLGNILDNPELLEQYRDKLY